ncbi:hypothetical protein G6F45_013883 [Rhizopus arrhizus]|nr:hypothetical protein G6F45_013883 [Rhizopus arrhizus]
MRSTPGYPLGDHHHHPDRVRTRARAVGRRARPCLPAVRRARQRQPLPRPLPAQPGADPGDRAVAEHAVRLPRPPHSGLHPQCPPVGPLAASLSVAGSADQSRPAHGHLPRRQVAE